MEEPYREGVSEFPGRVPKHETFGRVSNDAGDRRTQTPSRPQGPQIANVTARDAWMLTNNFPPSGLNVAPANSSANRGAFGGLLKRRRLRPMSKSSLPLVRPRVWF